MRQQINKKCVALVHGFIDLVVDHHRISLLVCSAFLLFGVIYGPKIKREGGASVLLSADDEAVRIRDEMSDVFGNPNIALLAIKAKDQLSPSDLALLEQVSLALEKDPIVTKVTTVFSAKYIAASPGGFKIEPLALRAPKDAAELAALREKLASNPAYRRNLIGESGQAVVAFVEFAKGTDDAAMYQAIHSVIEAYDQDKALIVSGLPIVNAQIVASMSKDQFVLVPLFFLVLMIIFYFSYSTILGVLLPTLLIAFTMLMTMATIVVIAGSLNVVTNVIPLLIASVASCYGIHFMSQYYAERQAFIGKPHTQSDVIKAAGKHVFGTVFVAGTTTAHGFLSDSTSSVQAVRSFGYYMALAVVYTAFATYVLLPSLLKIIPQKAAKPDVRLQSELLNKALNKLAVVVTTRYKAIVGLVLVACALCGYFMAKIEVVYTDLGYFKEGHEVVKSAREISREFGGVTAFDYVIETDAPRGMLRHDALQTLDQFGQWLEKEYPRDVRVHLSFADTVKSLSQGYNGGKEYYRIPDNDAEISQYVEMYSWSGNIEKDLKNVINKDFTKARFTGRVSLLENADGSFSERTNVYHGKLLDRGQQWLEQHLPAGFRVRQFGELPIWRRISDSIVGSQLSSIATAVFFVFLLTATFLGSIKYGLLCMVPVSIGVTSIFGVMGLTGIHLDLATSMISAMAIGIGIEDTIHFMLSYRENLAKLGEFKQAITKTLVTTGKTIMLTSITLIAGFLMFTFSDFKPVNNFGILNVVSIVVTTICALVVLPAAILISERARVRGV